MLHLFPALLLGFGLVENSSCLRSFRVVMLKGSFAPGTQEHLLDNAI